MFKNSSLLIMCNTTARLIHIRPFTGALLVIISSLANITFAQTDSIYPSPHNGHEISLGVGFLSHHDIIYKTWMFERQTKNITSYTGIWGIRYRRWFNKWAVGVQIAYEQVSGNFYDYYPPPPTKILGTFRRDLWSIAPEFMWVYGKTRDKSLRVYGYLNPGISYWNEWDYQGGNKSQLSQVDGAGQFCPIGVSYGDRYRGFVELGYGVKGVVNIGASVQFGRAGDYVDYQKSTTMLLMVP